MNIRRTIKQKTARMYETGALHITAGTFLTKFVAFFGSIVVVRLLSKEDYGVMSYVENIYSYALVFAALGMSNAILRYLVIAESAEEKKACYRYIIRRSIVINIGIAAVLAAAGLLMPIPDKFAPARYLIPVAALILPFQDLVNDGLFTIRAFFKNKLYAYAAFASAAALIIGRIIGALTAQVNGVLWSRVLINAAFAAAGLYFIGRKFFLREEVPPLSGEQKRTVNVYSLQYMITNGFWAIFMLNDKFMLGLLLNDPAGLADYNVASVLPGNIAIFATAIGIFVGPLFTKNEKDPEWVRRNFRKVYLAGAAIVGVISLLVALLARPLTGLIYGEQYLNTVDLMRLLTLGAFINSGLRYTTANILAAMGEIKYNMIISGAGIAVQILLDLILIPSMGLTAVAVSNCIVFFGMAAALLIVFYRKHYR